MQTDSKLTALLGIKHPIIQGPFGGGLSTLNLTSTVSNLGGLGSFGAHNLEPKEIIALAMNLRTRTEGSFAINLWVSDWDLAMNRVDENIFLDRVKKYEATYQKIGAEVPRYKGNLKSNYERQVECVLRAKPKVFSFVFGIPTRDILNECRRQNIITLGTATTVREALALEEAGVDAVLATGAEAGEHRPWFLEHSEKDLMGVFTLVPMIRDSVKIPVVAGGGIVDRRGVRAAMALGADAVQVGTAFLATEESGASNLHKLRILENTDGSTRLSKAFTGRWARFLPNAFLEEIDRDFQNILPFPAQSWVTGPIKRTATLDGDYEALYASQASSLVKMEWVKKFFNVFYRYLS